MDPQALRKSLRFKRGVSKYMPHPRGLVLAPTRELANQISDVLTPSQMLTAWPSPRYTAVSSTSDSSGTSTMAPTSSSLRPGRLKI